MYTTIDTPGTIVTISFLFFPYLFHYLVYTTLTFIFYKERIMKIIKSKIWVCSSLHILQTDGGKLMKDFKEIDKILEATDLICINCVI